MKKVILIFCMLIGVASCDLKGNAGPSIKWATVNVYEVKKVLQELGHKKIPYPEDVAFDREKVTEEMNAVRKQMSLVRSQLEKDCRRRRDKDFESEKVDPSVFSRIESITRKRGIPVRRDPECQKIIKTDPLMLDLESKNDEFIKRLREKRDFDAKISEMAGALVVKATELFSRGKYDLVISDQKNGIVFNQFKMVLDITDSVVGYVRENPHHFYGEQVD